jgi:hypothetical protein
LFPKIYDILLRPFDFIASKDLCNSVKAFWLYFSQRFLCCLASNLLALSVKLDEIHLYLLRRRKDMDVNERERLSSIPQIGISI